jgi:hypothetical protein
MYSVQYLVKCNPIVQYFSTSHTTVYAFTIRPSSVCVLPSIIPSSTVHRPFIISEVGGLQPSTILYAVSEDIGRGKYRSCSALPLPPIFPLRYCTSSISDSDGIYSDEQALRSTMSNSSDASLVVASRNDEVASILNAVIVKICEKAIAARGTFTVALSGGSLPSFLAGVDEAFKEAGVDAKYSCWQVILADERCVPSHDPDNNLRAIREDFLSKVPILDEHVHGIDERKLDESTEAVACAYEQVVKTVMESSGGLLDLAVLGFGPDGK